MDIKHIIQSRALKIILYGIGGMVVLLLAFQAGEFVGYHRARFSYQWGENYYHMFDARSGRMMGNFSRSDFPSMHGASGKIIKIEGGNIIVADRDNSEKLVLISDDTEIRRFRENIKFADLKVGDFIVAIGSPDDKGQIEARLLRVMPGFVGSATSSAPIK